jgi:O-antigen ligase
VKLTRTRRTYVLALAVGALVTAANASEGAYFSQSWGWIALAFLVPTSILLIVDGASAPGRMRASFAALMVALGVWIVLSAAWSISSAASIREVERMLVYVALALAVALVLRCGDGAAVLAGAGLGVTLICSDALATRLLPDRLHSYDDAANSHRLAAPLGYWNSLGLLAAIGVLVAIGFAAHARRTPLALASAGIIPISSTTLYFTFSRGAWVALTLGFVAAVAVDLRRIRLLWTSLVVAAPAAACIAYASTFEALTTDDAPAAAAAERAGHRVAAALCVGIAATTLAAWVARLCARRIDVSAPNRRRFAVALASCAVLAVVGALAVAGGPFAAFDDIQNRFNAEPAVVGGVDLNKRLFSVSGNGRSEQFRVAWNAGRERPLIGHGSGTYEYIWYEKRPDLLVVRDAHSLYLETFAELGVVGLALLVAALVVLVAGAIRARRMRFVGAAFGAFVAWSAAAAVDWHWEMVGVTLTALLVGAVGVVAAERRAPSRLRAPARPMLIVACVVLSVCAVWSLVGNQALFAGRDALARKDWVEARDNARRAQTLLFWSAEPELVLGDAAAGLGDRHGALQEYRDAVATDPRSWVAWLRVAQVARGPERGEAYRRVRQLNPREEGLPGE